MQLSQHLGAQDLSGGPSRGAAMSKEDVELSLEFRHLQDLFSEAAALLGLSRTNDYQQKHFIEFTASAAACRVAHALRKPSWQVTQALNAVLVTFAISNPARSLDANASLERSFRIHCILISNLDSIAHHSLLNDPLMSAEDVAGRLTFLDYLCDFFCDVQQEAQNFLRPGKAIPKTSLLEPSHLSARLSKFVWDPKLLTICFNSISAGSKGVQDNLYAYGDHLDSVRRASRFQPDSYKIDEVLKDVGYLKAAWGALGSSNKVVLRCAIIFLHDLILAPEMTTLPSTGNPRAKSLQTLLKNGAADAFAAALKHMHRLVVEQGKEGDGGNKEDKNKLSKEADLAELLLETIQGAHLLDYKDAQLKSPAGLGESDSLELM
ncbi:hypothetical protein DUNSADRAFT_9970 [Dunaliella salina]|uniref:Uncharacterized protein n=1 Tax=Dunaliella salina TaxID=3046 RepID=A0ABQ7GGC5_DUNSA|nr:hypothetical protein DUNSADRAFT_9970 [Dunaliella salina]|eukprot:KAF5833660.1 hypothetical protein DUNSADRAFT_9970 [Dunaliella salina]